MTVAKNDFNDEDIKRPNLIGVRHFQMCLMFGALVFGYFLRVNMSVAVVAMVEKPSEHSTADHFDWDSGVRSLILSSFFWGYVCAQLPSGLLAQRYGAQLVLSIASAICSVVTMLIPTAAKYGDWKAVCAMRVLVGFTQGSVYPCVHTLLSKWAPRPERGFVSTFIYSGAQIGTVIMLAISGVLSDTTMGWPSLFYFSGGVTLVWAILYFFIGTESPTTTKKITEEERNYIVLLTGNSEKKTAKTPWLAMMTSKPFIALTIAHCGFTWGFYTMLTEMPTYMSKALDMEIKTNALLSALPYFTMWVLSLIISPLADTLINRRITSVEVSRKLFNSIGQWIPMLALIGLAFMTKDSPGTAVFLLTVGVGLNAASYVGYLVNHMDLSPNFAGTMMGITNGISNLFSIFAPIVVGKVVPNEEDPYEWRIIFFLTAGIYFFCNLVFVLFGSASIQPWNEIEDENQNKENDIASNSQKNETITVF